MPGERDAPEGVRDRLDVPETATPEEAAAMAAAIAAHLDAERETGEAKDAGRAADWAGDRWRFRGRLETLQARSVRVPDGAPGDPWRAAGRSERL